MRRPSFSRNSYAELVVIGALILFLGGLATPVVQAYTPTVHLVVATYSDPGLTHPTNRVAEGGTLYVVVSLQDQSGNPATFCCGALQILLSPTEGFLTATNIFIFAGTSNTAASFGPILYTAPSETGPQRITASGFLSGVSQGAGERILVLPAVAIS